MIKIEENIRKCFEKKDFFHSCFLNHGHQSFSFQEKQEEGNVKKEHAEKKQLRTSKNKKKIQKKIFRGRSLIFL